MASTSTRKEAQQILQNVKQAVFGGNNSDLIMIYVYVCMYYTYIEGRVVRTYSYVLASGVVCRKKRVND